MNSPSRIPEDVRKRHKGFVSGYRNGKEITLIRVETSDSMLIGRVIEVKGLADGVSLQIYDKVTFLVRIEGGTPCAHDVRLAIPMV